MFNEYKRNGNQTMPRRHRSPFQISNKKRKPELLLIVVLNMEVVFSPAYALRSYAVNDLRSMMDLKFVQEYGSN